jgi:hypothetical protein
MEYIGKLESPFEIKPETIIVNAENIFSAVTKVIETLEIINLQLYNVVVSTPTEKVMIKEGPKEGYYLTYEIFEAQYKFFWASGKTFLNSFVHLQAKYISYNNNLVLEMK